MAAWLRGINLCLCFITAALCPSLLRAQEPAAQGQWQSIGPGGGGWIEALAVDPYDPMIVYAGSDVGGVFKSVDGGKTWQTANHGLKNDFIRAIVIDPGDSRVIYLATAGGVHKSTDAGKSWELKRSGFPPVSRDGFSAPINALAVSPEDSNILYAGIGNRESYGSGRLYKSRDAGESWFPVNAPNQIPAQAVIFSIRVHPAGQNSIYIATDYGIYKSEDGGTSWKAKNSGLAHLGARDIAISKNPPYRMFAAIGAADKDSTRGDSAIYRSEDLGESWLAFAGGLPADYRSIEISPENPDVCYAGDASWQNAGLYKTYDAGISWVKTTASRNIADYGWLTQWGLSINCIALAPGNPRVIYAGTSGHIIKSEDAGRSWRQIYTRPLGNRAYTTRGLETTCVHSVTIDPKDPKTVYAGFFDIGLMKSRDAGASFQRVVQGMDYDNSVFTLLIDPDNSSALYAGIGEWSENRGSICASFDGARSWRVIGKNPALPQGRARFIRIDPESPIQSRHIYAAIEGQGIFMTQDNGRNWACLNSGFDFSDIRGLLLQPQRPSTIYLAAGRSEREKGGIYISDDRGMSWKKIQAGIEFPNIQAMTFGPEGASALYIACREYYDPASGDYFPGGLYKSLDAGRSWTKLLEDKFVSAVAIGTRNTKIIYAACPDHNYHDLSRGRGILRSADSGITWEPFNENLGSLRVNALAISPGEPAVLYCGSAGNGLFKRGEAEDTI